MPPTFVLPVTLPENVQSVMMPVESFSPVMPPTLFSPSTLPVNVQEMMLPLLCPAIPPMFYLIPSGETLPVTLRFFT